MTDEQMSRNTEIGRLHSGIQEYQQVRSGIGGVGRGAALEKTTTTTRAQIIPFSR